MKSVEKAPMFAQKSLTRLPIPELLALTLICAMTVNAQMFPERVHAGICIGKMDGMLFPDQNNCDAFVQCQNGVAVPQRCQSGTFFDLNLYYCVAANSVDCGDRRQSNSQQSVPPNSNDIPSSESHHSICRNVRDGALFANPSNCQAFVECQHGLRLDRECSMNELFDPLNGVCLSDFAVDCGARPRMNGQSPSKESGRIPQNICQSLPTGTRISNSEDCRSYFECRNSQRVELACLSSELFDMTVNRCRPANSVNCGSRRSVSNALQQHAICQGQRDGRTMGNPNNCRAYIECQGNFAIDRTCEIGTLFDSQLESCLESHLVRCGARGLPPIDTQTPEDFFPPCPQTGVSFRTHPHDCQTYFICAHGHMIQHSCANGIHFNPETLQCDFAQNVRCRISRIVIPQTPLLPDCSTGQDFFPNLINCKQYYTCVEKQPQLMDCPNGYLWDNAKLRCAKSDSEICARSFNAANRTFTYGKPRPDEKRV